MIKIKKLDKRMAGSAHFKYMIDFVGYKGGTVDFIKIRQWCTDTFGNTVELDFWPMPALTAEHKSPQWSWENGEFTSSVRRRIYIADDQTLSFLKLAWP